MKNNEAVHSIRIASERSGLIPHTLRAWEKRYQAIQPTRSSSGRRLYSESDIERLLLLHRATVKGHKIGEIAHLENRHLLEITNDVRGASVSQTVIGKNGTSHIIEQGDPPFLGFEEPELSKLYLFYSLEAVGKLDELRLEKILSEAAESLGPIALIEKVILPMMKRIGELWIEGRLRIVHEHLASSVVRSLLAKIGASHKPIKTAPLLMGATPLDQFHELGLLTALAIAASEGWRTLYVGTNLHSKEIAETALKVRPISIILSLGYPYDDPQISKQLRMLHQQIPPETVLVCGGSGMDSYRQILEELDFALWTK